MIQYLCFRRVGKNASRVLPLSIWLLCVGPFVAYAVRMYFATSAATKRSKHQGFGTLIAGFAGQHTKRAPEWMYALRAYRMVKQLTVEPNSIMAGALAGGVWSIMLHMPG